MPWLRHQPTTVRTRASQAGSTVYGGEAMVWLSQRTGTRTVWKPAAEKSAKNTSCAAGAHCPLRADGRPQQPPLSAAAAARAGADVLRTHNLSDFPADDRGMNCTALTPADLFAHLAELYPEDLAAVIRRSAAGLSRPPLTAHEVLDKLAEVGLGEMATHLRSFMP